MSESTTEMTGVMIDPVTGEIIDQKELAERLLAQAKEQGVSLVGPGGLPKPSPTRLPPAILESHAHKVIYCGRSSSNRRREPLRAWGM
ncbi:hypothetical protein [Pseudarthrobacter sp. NPDC080039]|uniref:hypothetical protein n=1 Tax=unclassified Pseudarthrobacter TaxID=2647000 RepID=UPI00344CF0EA